MTTGLNLLSMYHDALLARRLGEEKIKPLIPPSELSRYTRAWAERQPSYRHAARTLEIFRFTQLLFEMMLRRRAGKRNTWRGILALEFVKYVGHSLSSTSFTISGGWIALLHQIISRIIGRYFLRRLRPNSAKCSHTLKRRVLRASMNFCSQKR